MPYANNKGAVKPVHRSSLISAFVVYCMEIVIPVSKILWFLQASVTEQASMSLTWSYNYESSFCYDMAKILPQVEKLQQKKLGYLNSCLKRLDNNT